MSGAVVDTNVLVVASERTPQADAACVLSCIDALVALKAGGPVWVDSDGRIFEEYRQNLSFSGQPGVGDAFFKWLWDNQFDEDHCRQVAVTSHPVRGFEEFPEDPALRGFDTADRKFVAVAFASGENPEVLNASDTDWWQFHQELAAHRIRIRFLCPDLMQP